MKDVTHKPDTLRSAVAEAVVEAPGDVIALLRERKLEKGDALEIGRAAGVLAAKRTPEFIPYCHPLPLTGIAIDYAFGDSAVRVRATVRTVAPTGVEMEALVAASAAALTLWDMMKPHTDELAIGGVTLVEKKGGKSQWREVFDPPLRAAVVVLSDTVAAGKKPDRAGKAVIAVLEEQASVGVERYEILPDDPERLQGLLRKLVEAGIDLVITVGGTGLAATDKTVEAVRPLLDVEIPGIMEAARAHGQRRTPRAMLSRGIAGLIGNTLVATFPGSSRGARETAEALFPGILHTFHGLRRMPHAHGYR